MRRIKAENRGHSTWIDDLSKYGWATPVKNKSAANVAEGYKNILKE